MLEVSLFKSVKRMSTFQDNCRQHQDMRMTLRMTLMPLREKGTVHCRYWRSVKRSVFMDDFVYAIASDQISVSNIADLEHPVSSIDLAMPDN